jgi:hypothetical protein
MTLKDGDRAKAPPNATHRQDVLACGWSTTRFPNISHNSSGQSGDPAKSDIQGW